MTGGDHHGDDDRYGDESIADDGDDCRIGSIVGEGVQGTLRSHTSLVLKRCYKDGKIVGRQELLREVHSNNRRGGKRSARWVISQRKSPSCEDLRGQTGRTHGIALKLHTSKLPRGTPRALNSSVVK